MRSVGPDPVTGICPETPHGGDTLCIWAMGPVWWFSHITGGEWARLLRGWEDVMVVWERAQEEKTEEMASGDPFAHRAALNTGGYKYGKRWYQTEGAWCSHGTLVLAGGGSMPGAQSQPPGVFVPCTKVSDLEITNLRLRLGWPRLGCLLPVWPGLGDGEWLYQGDKGSCGGVEQGATRHEPPWRGPGSTPLFITWFGFLHHWRFLRAAAEF